MRLLISPDQVKIENTDLLRKVLDGENIGSWKYVDVSQVKDSMKPDYDFNIDEFEKKLEDEMKLKEDIMK